ncbi:hypothetical protein [Robertmurraya korlensis]|nr:hypothetical protein [Robertmurraya korlensis]
MVDKKKERNTAEEVEANQAEALRNQAGSSGKYGTEFASTDNKVTRKIEP